MGKLTSYKFNDEKNILNDTYKVLEANKDLKVFDSNTYKKLKYKYIHHSSDNDSFVNRASSEEKKMSSMAKELSIVPQVQSL